MISNVRGHDTQRIFFFQANKVFIPQKSFFATLIKLCYAKKVFCYTDKFFATQKSFFGTCFFSVPIFRFFVSFIILICNPVFFLLLQLFCFNFSFSVFMSLIFATQFFYFKFCFLFFFKRLKGILLLICFIFLLSYKSILFFQFKMYIRVFLLLILLYFCMFLVCMRYGNYKAIFRYFESGFTYTKISEFFRVRHGYVMNLSTLKR